jgi:hypothetical protein
VGLAYDRTHIRVRSYAREKKRADNAVPRSTRGASRGVLECGSGAVVATGCNTHTRVATAEAARSRRASRASRGLLAACRTGGANRPGMSRPPQRWLGLPRESGSLKGRPPGVAREQASNTARGTPEKWRTCGYDNRAALHRKASLRLSLARGDQARGSVRTPASRAALTFRRRSYPKTRARNVRAGTRAADQ